MDLCRKLLWIDGLGAAVAGVVVLLAINWLEEWTLIPRDILCLMMVHREYISTS